MERKTKVNAEAGKQELIITREFDLPVTLLFKAYADPEIVAQWMNTKVLKLENEEHGVWHFETSQGGNVVFAAKGVTLEFVPDQKVTRTFKMENTGVPEQLEFLEFTALTSNTSSLKMQIVFKSVEFRDQLLKMPFAQGINFAHNRLEEILNK